MQKDVRGVLCDGIISDLDIVNCHPNILSWICKQNDILCPNLDHYIQNRDKILNKLRNEHNFDREDAKKLFLKATNSIVAAGIIGSIAAACECEIDGNKPINVDLVLQKIDSIEKKTQYN